MRDLQRGEQIGVYRIIELVGSGAVGAVYQARHCILDRDVAFICLQIELDPEMKTRFLMESKVCASLSHPNIVTTHDAGEVDGIAFLVTEFVRGMSLDELVHESGPVSLSTAVDYVIQAARGLEYTHELSVSHGNIGPQTLKLDESGVIRICGFGTSRFHNTMVDHMHGLSPNTPSSFGTPPYIAPGQQKPRLTGVQLDICGLGFVLYYLATGCRVALPRESIKRGCDELIGNMGNVQSLGEVMEGVPPLVDRVMGKMIGIGAKQRYDSMAKVIDDLLVVQGCVETTPAIFISYRRDDSYDATHRLYETLSERYGREAIFMDVDTIPAGVDFRDHLKSAVAKCDLLLAVIGDHWLSDTTKDGQRRIDDPADYVRLEIEAALVLGKRVVPVLVGRATMPSESQLPEGIKKLAFRQLVELRSGRDYDENVSTLIRHLDRKESDPRDSD